MKNRDRREALRGAEEETFSLLAEVLTSQQWAELLKAPLGRAVAEGNRGLALKLVGAGAEIGDALHTAAWSGHEEVANNLLQNGASIVARDTSVEGNTPLHLAARAGETKMVRLLLVKGADIDSLNNSSGYTPLCLAALYGNAAAALALMAAGADISLRSCNNNESVLHLAAETGNVEISRAAIERGADIHAVNSNQETALHGAAHYGRVELIDVLVETGANIEARDRHGCTALHVAASMACAAVVSTLLKHGAHVNAQDEDENTPLHLAAGIAGVAQNTEVVDSLLRPGADETILNHQGQTAADMIGLMVEEEEDQVAAEDVDRVHELLANAPVDRAWRRRGYLVLCRAYPDRMQLLQDISSAPAGVARKTRISAKQGKTDKGSCTGTAEGGMVDGGRTCGDWVGVVAKVLMLQEEGLFRGIMGYL